MAQIFSQRRIIKETSNDSLNAWAKSRNPADKKKLEQEVSTLSQSKDEIELTYAAWGYGILGQPDKAQELNSFILKQFPNGVTALTMEYLKIFDDPQASAETLEDAYQHWLTRFPEDSFPEKYRGYHRKAPMAIALQYAKEGNMEKVNSYLTNQNVKKKDSYNIRLASAKEFMVQNKPEIAILLLQELYLNLKSLYNKKNTTKEDSYFLGYFPETASLLGQALLANGQIDAALQPLQDFDSIYPDETNTIALARAWMQKEKNQEAFDKLHNYIMENGANRNILNVLEPIYMRLNDKATFQTYIDKYINPQLAQKKAELEKKYRAEMINKTAPAFSLQDRKGNIVSLADLAGKVVVLDFWATWCVPCVGSFPGMQATVDQYKDDNEVQFLFINCFEQEENHKEQVIQFMLDKKYNFEVLFDKREGEATSTAELYNVQDIPTKIVIDKAGLIRFKYTGGNFNAEESLMEMETMIELAKQ
ncbi:hypothetical protein BWD42_07140 [Sphingobacterium sp. CZ-UAM]|uniref:TlpA family protein disulfide reductase n=1 Tax=Sphingobacterium sp. CZ-UAM TaxID=1933868 RepID=UPI0009D38234|nr:TlpA disulfide reductase family protein [Sphingobacterium sp. CZ-UAM]OOG19677.1 hypothetical protein BWD42_07140 [Sphingobacterium sp. CZ-UAM]